MQVAVHKLLAKYPDVGSITTTGVSCGLHGQMGCMGTLPFLWSCGSTPRELSHARAVAGHSLGGALASLSAYDLAFSEINRVGDFSSGELIPVTAFTFEAPRVGECTAACMHDTSSRVADACPLPR